ncbi:CBS domain-containing protein [Sphaerobacter thermophilus]|uniref:Putative signal transduction protein with CBS domains n=1 Tax=Sphaerobacter thermophilus (strain ATCC 49802 / DSM 20745 / KCCM 41009 / NCIMB 13125 / S 6022) TaxID=479434 RepID=D1C2S1_SPHTD|nr:CBS domain-containing protein [Sphaerobacter thermophilus]ACZ38538.1 putative signal transduction protein with CBS domains [Sphaerobacter thermophilus DSM 20745]PZN68064.1 MAG: CBS domain-containing protein [Sphaerobacter thermophilus]
MTQTTMEVTVKEIMTPNVITVFPQTGVDEVARLLYAHRISGMPVVDETGALLGIVSEFDVISKKGRTAADIMTRDVISVLEDALAEQVAGILTERNVRRVPVTSEGRLVGIVSRSDLVRLFSITRWACPDCGYFVRGFHRPDACEMCGSTAIELQRDPPGM